MNNKHIFIFFLTIHFFACDIIEEPFINQMNQVNEYCDEYYFGYPNNTKRKILLEYYTGHQCSTCPPAGSKVSELLEIYNDDLIAISIHAGFFARISSNYPTDYTSEVGNDWDYQFGNSDDGPPNGLVNRVNFLNNQHILKYTEWEENIINQISLTQNLYDLQIQLNSSFDENEDLICIDSRIDIGNYNQNDIRFKIVITEDSLISRQKDESSPNGYVENYIHNNVLRKSLNGSWGVGLNNQNSSQIFLNRYSINKNYEWNINNINIIGIIYDIETYEVLQAEKNKLIN